MKRANVFARRGWIYSNPVSMTVTGPFVCLPPVTKAIATAQNSELGRMLRTALGQSRSGLMFDTRTPLTTHEDAVGVKTFGEFVRGTVMAGVEMDESVIRFEPYYNRGAGEGFAHVPDDAFTIQTTSSDEELGNAIRRVLALSK